MTRTLLQISDDMQALDELLAEVEGDISDPKVQEAFDAFFAEIETNLKGKVDGYCGLINEMSARAYIRTTEAHRLMHRAKVDEDAMAWLKARLKAFLEGRALRVLETDRYKVTVAGNGGKAPLDISTIPRRCHTSTAGTYPSAGNLTATRFETR
jgi:hypothetical protein